LHILQNKESQFVIPELFDLCRRIDALESRYDEQFRIIFDALRELMAPPSSPESTQRIGFRLE